MTRLRVLFTYMLNKIPSNNFHIIFHRHSKSSIGIVIGLHRVIAAKGNRSPYNDYIEMSAAKLEELIIKLKKLKAKFVSLNELKDCLEAKKKISHSLVHLSFDDGYYDNYSVAFEILKKHNISFSVFITSGFISKELPFVWWYIIEGLVKNERPVRFERYDFSISQHTYANYSKAEIFQSLHTFLLNNVDDDKNYFEAILLDKISESEFSRLSKMLTWENVNEMIASGFCEIGVHTKTHPRFASLTPAQQIEEILCCKNEIRSRTNVDAKYFAYPYGSKDDIGNIDTMNEVMTKCDIELAFTTVPEELNSKSNKIFLPRIMLNENATTYTLKSRLNGSYQRNLLLKEQALWRI